MWKLVLPVKHSCLPFFLIVYLCFDYREKMWDCFLLLKIDLTVPSLSIPLISHGSRLLHSLSVL